jgi:POT family proton-dependent oligopeptide transporter
MRARKMTIENDSATTTTTRVPGAAAKAATSGGGEEEEEEVQPLLSSSSSSANDATTLHQRGFHHRVVETTTPSTTFLWFRERRRRRRRRRSKSSLWSQPLGLFCLGGTEIWERFSYYTTRAVLVLYARDAIFATEKSLESVWFASSFASWHGVDLRTTTTEEERRMRIDAISSKLYGTYTAFVYLTPVLGGYLADFTSKHGMISIGILVMFAGNFLVGAERNAFFLGLFLVAVGNGGFKPNVSARLSEMYERKLGSGSSGSGSSGSGSRMRTSSSSSMLLSKKDSAFGIFYCAINVGALFAPLVAGFLADRFGYQSCFVAAAVGMVAAGLVYFTFQERLVYRGAALDIVDERGSGRDGRSNIDNDDDDDDEERSRFGITAAENDNGDEEALLPRNPESNEEEVEVEEEHQHHQQQQNKLSLLHVFNENKARLIALFVVMLTTVGFWAAYEQAGNALSLFIDERVSRDGVPTAAFQSINPGMILALTPVINRYWKYQSETNSEPDQVMKMAIGCCLLGLANVILAFASTNLPSGAVAEADLPPGSKLNQFWIWLYFLVATAGELYVSPVGLSFVTTAAPKEIVGLACGCWFLSSFFGNYLAGEIGAYYARAKPFTFWFCVGGLSCSVGVALALLRRRIVRALKKSDDENNNNISSSSSSSSEDGVNRGALSSGGNGAS